LGYGKGKIGGFLFSGLVFGTFMLYEVFEKLMFGDSCLTFCSGLKVVMCFCASFSASVSLLQLDVYDYWVFDLLLIVGKKIV